MGISDIFSRKKAALLSENIDALLDSIDGALLVFKGGVKDYLYGEEAGFAENLAKMATLETEALARIRAIENTLYAGG